MIKYRKPNGNRVKIEGDLFVCKDKHGKKMYAGDKFLYLGWRQVFIVTFTSDLQWIGVPEKTTVGQMVYLTHASDLFLIEEE